MAKKKSAKRASEPQPLATAADVNTRSDAGPVPTHDEIAQAAYLRYLQRGGGDGRDFDDWVEAERELSKR